MLTNQQKIADRKESKKIFILQLKSRTLCPDELHFNLPIFFVHFIDEIVSLKHHAI
jgi:hypothetical protein